MMPLWRDADDDGYGDRAVKTEACSPDTGWVTNSLDCDDTDPAVHPRAAETCNGIDDHCDGAADEDCPTDTGGGGDTGA